MSARGCAVCEKGYIKSGGSRGRRMTCWCCHGFGHAGEGYFCPQAAIVEASRKEAADRTGKVRSRVVPTEAPEDRPDGWPTRAEAREEL